MIETILRDLRQPEYIHVLINPLPVYGLGLGLIGLIIALILHSRPAKIATLTIVLISAASAWPVYEYGERGYDRVLTMTDDAGHAWLDEHRDRGEDLIYFFYALAVLVFGTAVLGMAGYIAYAGGKIRHREFRNASPPPIKSEEER